MQDRYYIEKTKSTYKSVSSWLEKRGFKLESYGDIDEQTAEAYYIKPGIMYKLIYQWIPNPNGRGVVAGKMISLEDMTSCFRTILGKPTGYK